MKLADLVSWLDEYLAIGATPDSELALNGLQVENAGAVERVAVAVDGCQAVIDQTAALHADLLIVHHGLFWGGLEPLTGRVHRRFAALLRHGIAVYGAHLPLDRHPEVGNNVELARLIGLEIGGWWGDYKGAPIGVWGEMHLDRAALGEQLATVLGTPPRLIRGGHTHTTRIGIVTGAGGPMIAEAKAAGIDTFITGEAKHHAFFDAEELGVNVFLAGHYATETLGVKALAAQLERRFGLPWTFIDHPTGL